MGDDRRGAGDRWLAGSPVDGVHFGQHDRVTVTTGRFAGAGGTVTLLLDLGDDPLYLVTLAAGGPPVRVRQSALRTAA